MGAIIPIQAQAFRDVMRALCPTLDFCLLVILSNEPDVSWQNLENIRCVCEKNQAFFSWGSAFPIFGTFTIKQAIFEELNNKRNLQ